MFVSANLFAQLEVKKDSFKEVPGFVNINIDKMYDDNDKPYAVLKIKTENVDSIIIGEGYARRGCISVRLVCTVE